MCYISIFNKRETIDSLGLKCVSTLSDSESTVSHIVHMITAFVVIIGLHGSTSGVRCRQILSVTGDGLSDALLRLIQPVDLEAYMINRFIE